MQKERLKQICQIFCTAFPELEFAVLTPQEQPVYLHSPRGLLAAAELPAAPGKFAEVIGGIPYRVVYHTFSEGYQLAAFFSIADPGYTSLPAMADTLVRLVYAQRPVSTSQNENALFFNHLLHTTTPDKQSCLSLLSTDFAYDFSLPRFICVIEARAQPQLPQSLWEQSMGEMLQFVRHHAGVHKQDITGLLNPDKIVICKAVSPADYPLKTCCEKMLGGLIEAMQLRFSVVLRVGVGYIAEQIGEYSFCLKAAHSVLQETPEKGSMFIYAIDHLPQMLLDNAPAELLHHYFSEYVQLLGRHPDWVATLDALVRCNMDLTEAAASLYLHKNSLIFRLKHMLRELRLDSLQSDQTKYFFILLHHYCQRFAQESEPAQ